MIKENIYGFSERKFKLQIDRKRLLRLLDCLRDVFGFVEIKFNSRKK